MYMYYCKHVCVLQPISLQNYIQLKYNFFLFLNIPLKSISLYNRQLSIDYKYTDRIPQSKVFYELKPKRLQNLASLQLKCDCVCVKENKSHHCYKLYFISKQHIVSNQALGNIFAKFQSIRSEIFYKVHRLDVQIIFCNNFFYISTPLHTFQLNNCCVTLHIYICS